MEVLKLDDVSEELVHVYETALKEAGVENQAPDPFGKVMGKALESIKDLAKRVEKDHVYIDQSYRPILNRLMVNYLDRIPEITYHFNLSYEYYTAFQLNLSVDNIRQIVPILRILTAEGLKILDRPAKGGDSPSKVWSLGVRDRKAGAPMLTILVSAKKCERKQVGVKEVPVYETVCQWGDEIPELPEEQ